MSESPLERALAWALKALAPDLPEPRREYHAIPGRRFRYDFAWPRERVLVEVQGGIYAKGRTAHTGPSLARDFAKANAAACAGYRLLLFGPRDLDRRSLPATVQTIREALQA